MKVSGPARAEVLQSDPKGTFSVHFFYSHLCAEKIKQAVSSLCQSKAKDFSTTQVCQVLEHSASVCWQLWRTVTGSVSKRMCAWKGCPMVPNLVVCLAHLRAVIEIYLILSDSDLQISFKPRKYHYSNFHKFAIRTTVHNKVTMLWNTSLTNTWLYALNPTTSIQEQQKSCEWVQSMNNYEHFNSYVQ